MGRGPQFFPLPGKQTKQTSPGSLAQLPPQPPHAHAHKVLARGGMPGWVGMGRPLGASGGWALWDAEVGRVPKVGWASWHQCPTLAERRGRPPPHLPLPDDGARSAPLAWLAPAEFQVAPKLAWMPEPWVRAGGVSQKLENHMNTCPSHVCFVSSASSLLHCCLVAWALELDLRG